MLVFVAVVNPNNKFEIYVDQSLIHSGSLLQDMTSVALLHAIYTIFLLACIVLIWLIAEISRFEMSTYDKSVG